MSLLDNEEHVSTVAAHPSQPVNVQHLGYSTTDTYIKISEKTIDGSNMEDDEHEYEPSGDGTFSDDQMDEPEEVPLLVLDRNYDDDEYKIITDTLYDDGYEVEEEVQDYPLQPG